MDNRFAYLFAGLSEDRAIALLEMSCDELEDPSERYVAASRMSNFPPSDRGIQALIAAVKNADDSLDNRIVRRKAVETLGRYKATTAREIIQACLTDDDSYLVENSAWALAEIGCDDADALATMTAILEKPGQSYRAIIQALAKLNYKPAIARLEAFATHDDPSIASAAIAAICRLSADNSRMSEVAAFLQHENVNARRGCIQDLIDTHYYAAIPDLARCPVSIVFRLRAIRQLAEAGMAEAVLTFEADVQPYLEQVLRDRPSDITFVHAYDRSPSLEFTISELYSTDFGRCYLASQKLLDNHAEAAGPALLETYRERAHNDYGAHYHVVKMLGWLKYTPGYNILVEALNNATPQFQKSRAAAALALAEIEDDRAIPELHRAFETEIWDLKYAALTALAQFGDTSERDRCLDDSDWCVRAKARSL
ncbi:MAG: HEAT repeat domain-containing protein [Cyanobacteria bacterium P01_F01_bin.33]